MPRRGPGLRKCWLLLAALLIGCVTPTLAAEPPRLIASDSATTPRWTAYTMRSVGQRFDITFDITTSKEPLQLGAMVYNADNTWRGGFHWTSYLYQDSHYVDLAVPGTGTPVHVREQRAAYGFSLRVGAGFAPLPGSVEAPQTYKLLVWVIGDTAKGWRYDITGPGVTVAQPEPVAEPDPDGKPKDKDKKKDEGGADPTVPEYVTTGDVTLLAMSKDFDAPVNAGAQASILPVPDVLPYGFGPGVRATADGQKSFAANNFLFGTFQVLNQGNAFAAQANVARVDTENGLSRDCSRGCNFFDLVRPKGLPDGRYTFRETGAGAGIGAFNDILLGVMDVRLP